MVACLQSMRLHRLSSHRDGLKMIRAGLAGGRGRSSRSKSKTSSTGLRLRQRLYPWIQAYAWDASHTFLILSVVFMIAGIAVLVWVSTMNGPDQPDDAAWWDENSKVRALGVENCIFWIAILGTLLIFLVISRWPSRSLVFLPFPLLFYLARRLLSWIETPRQMSRGARMAASDFQTEVMTRPYELGRAS